jgi:imidazolonepropionase-like amidohydrolase
LKCGVTTVRDLGSNFTNIKRYMDHLEAGHFHGPDVYYSSFWATGDYYLQDDDIKGWDGTKYDCPWSRMFSIKDSTDAAIEKAVLEAKEIGCTGFKLYINYSKDDLARVIPIIKKHGMKVWAHATQYNGAKSLDVAQSGVDVVSHSYMLSNDYTIRDTITACELDSIRTVCKELIKNNVVLDITAHIAISAEMNFAIPITKEVYSQGVEFVVGTDYFGCAVPDEIKQLKKLGFANLDILRAATSTGAKILGMAGKLGIIKEGAQADIIVLS